MPAYFEFLSFEDWMTARGFAARESNDGVSWFDAEGNRARLLDLEGGGGFQSEYQSARDAAKSRYNDPTPTFHAVANPGGTQNLGLVPVELPFNPQFDQAFIAQAVTLPDGTIGLPYAAAVDRANNYARISGAGDVVTRFLDTNWVLPLGLAFLGAAVGGFLDPFSLEAGAASVPMPATSGPYNGYPMPAPTPPPPPAVVPEFTSFPVSSVTDLVPTPATSGPFNGYPMPAPTPPPPAAPVPPAVWTPSPFSGLGSLGNLTTAAKAAAGIASGVSAFKALGGSGAGGGVVPGGLLSEWGPPGIVGAEGFGGIDWTPWLWVGLGLVIIVAAARIKA